MGLRIAVWAYLDNNLGDDLMIKLLADAFIEDTFYIYTSKSTVVNTFKDNKNLIVKKPTELKKDIKIIDAYVSIGGSIFNNINSFKGQIIRLHRILFLIKLKIRGVKIATLGCNLGPYSNKMGPFLTLMELKFNDLVTVRDKESYHLVKKNKSIRNVHLISDIVYNLKVNISSEKNIGLGITAYRSTKLDEHNYENYKAIAKICNEFINKSNKRVKIFAFDTEYENDLSAAFHIYKMIDRKEMVDIEAYLGNTEEFIDNMSKCETMLAIRFHGAILADIMRIPFLPIVYSNKMKNLLEDRGYTMDYLGLDDLNMTLNFNDIVDKILDEKGLFNNFSKEQISAFKHFDEFKKLFILKI